MRKTLLYAAIFFSLCYGVLYYFSMQSDRYRKHAIETVALAPSAPATAAATTTEEVTLDTATSTQYISLVATDTETALPQKEEAKTDDKKVPAKTPVAVKTIATTTPIVIIPPSTQVLKNGILGSGWKNNSWGIRGDSERLLGVNSLTIDFLNQWSAYSLYSSGMSLKDLYTVSLTISSEDANTNHLFLSFYSGKERIGGVPLASYLDNSPLTHTLMIPIADAKMSSTTITDILLESDAPTTIELRNILLLKESGSTKIAVAVAPTVAPEVAPPAPAPTPAPQPLASSANIYFKGIQDHWVFRTWKIDLDPMNEEKSITGLSMKVHFNSTTSALYLEHPQGIATKGYDTLSISVYGGVTDHEWQQLYVTLYDANGKKLGTHEITDFTSPPSLQMQTWKTYVLPLWAFNASDTVIKAIGIENASITQDGDYVWIDGVGLGM